MILKKLLLLGLLLISISLSAQEWLNPHPTILKDLNKKAPAPFSELIGVTGQHEIQSVPSNNAIHTLRRFHLMELDFAEYYYPSELMPIVNDCDCSNTFAVGCVQSGGLACSNALPSFADNKNWTCIHKNNLNFGPIHASLDAINVRTPNPPCDPLVKISRAYPNKWYNGAEWGGTESDIRLNAAIYTTRFAASFCPTDNSKPCLINVLEMGNEPWGQDIMTKDQYRAIFRGVVDGMIAYYGADTSNWRMKLSTPAFQAYYPKGVTDYETYYQQFGVGRYQYIGDMIPEDIRPYIQFTNIHCYAFARESQFGTPFSTLLSFMPEHPKGGFLNFKNMVAWTRKNMPHADVNVTEFGWNSGQDYFDGCHNLGQAGQAAYLVRAYLLAARYGIKRAFNYRFNPAFGSEAPLYCTTGILDSNRDPKKSYHALNNWIHELGDLYFLKALTENYDTTGQPFAFLVGDDQGNPTHLIAWRSDTLTDTLQGYPNAELSAFSMPNNLFLNVDTSNAFYLGWDTTLNKTLAQGKAHQIGDSIQIHLSALPIAIPVNSQNCWIQPNGRIDCILQPICLEDNFDYLQELVLSGDTINTTIDTTYGFEANTTQTIHVKSRPTELNRAFYFLLWMDRNRDQQFQRAELLLQERVDSLYNGSITLPVIDTGTYDLHAMYTCEKFLNRFTTDFVLQRDTFSIQIIESTSPPLSSQIPDTVVAEKQKGIQFKNLEDRFHVAYLDTTQVSKTATAEDVRLFPNPANTRLNIVRDIPFPIGTKIELFNVSGQLVTAEQITAVRPLAQINLPGLSSGIYYLRVTDDREVLFTKPVMVAQ